MRLALWSWVVLVLVVGCSPSNDPCAGSPCANDGVCVPRGASFACFCASGFSGPTCEVDVDACAAAPCFNGGLCTDTPTGFSCACLSGFSGRQCETNVDACAQNPCANGGLCIDRVDGFACACRPGFSGTTCELDLDECSPNPCANGGVCTDRPGGFSCACASGFTGLTCEVNVDDCAGAPCENGGICVDRVGGSVCACPAGFTGTRCELNVDDCHPNPCFNGALCLDGVDGFTCKCNAGTWGALCQGISPQLEIATTTVAGGAVGAPFSRPLTRAGGNNVVTWSLDAGSAAWLAIDAATGTLSGQPGQGDVGTVAALVRVEDPLWPDNFAERQFSFPVVSAPPALVSDFETCPAGWTLSGDWQCGVPMQVGPPAAAGGTRCLGTQLAGNYGNLQVFAQTTATSPAMTLHASVPMRLTFRAWVDTEGGTADGFNVSISTNGGQTYSLLTDVTPSYPLVVANRPAWGGHQAALGWQTFSAALSGFEGQTVRIRFAFQSDSSGTFPGVYLDDVRVAF